MPTVAEWEYVFRLWKGPSSDTEKQKCANAESMIQDAINECDLFADREIEVFAQGSYRNNTNVKNDSDVDVCVRCMHPFFTDYSSVPGLTRETLGFVEGKYSYAQFKNDVEMALVDKFGEDGVTRGDKAFDIHENSYRIDADVVATFEHRRYHQRLDGEYYFHSGTQFHPDSGGKIINWPEQHHANGVEKNKATGNRFKYLTRVLKRLRNSMVDDEIAAAGPVPSYLIECLVWNVPDEKFGNDEYYKDMRSVLAHLYNNTMKYEDCKEWGEVNELKYLFRKSQPWRLVDAHAFIGAAWDYIGYE